MRLCYALDLKDNPELIARYREWHAPGGPPSAVNAAIRKSAIHSLEIYLTGNRLFMVMEAGPEFSAAAKARADAANPDVQGWERLMWEFQQPLPWAAPGEKWVPMERIYDLGSQPSE
jgi:L-rhamnose mutarotase